ncbi:MAG: hypothetical protein ACYTFM_07485, partial [Planctomycetota bacterium]
MNPKDIDNLIKKLNLQTSAELDSKINDQIDALAESQKPKPATQPNIWRMIMKSKITKLTAAAVIIIAVLIGIKQFSGSIDGTSVAWGEVVEQINNYTRYKCRQRVVRKQGPEFPTMQVYHLNLSQRRQEVENGDIHVI